MRSLRKGPAPPSVEMAGAATSVEEKDVLSTSNPMYGRPKTDTEDRDPARGATDGRFSRKERLARLSNDDRSPPTAPDPEEKIWSKPNPLYGRPEVAFENKDLGDAGADGHSEEDRLAHLSNEKRTVSISV